MRPLTLCSVIGTRAIARFRDRGSSLDSRRWRRCNFHATQPVRQESARVSPKALEINVIVLAGNGGSRVAGRLV